MYQTESSVTAGLPQSLDDAMSYLLSDQEFPPMFDWECFYHVDDFLYCLSRSWITLLLIYLGSIVIFLIFAGIILYLRYRRRTEQEARLEEEAALYERIS